MDKIYNVAGNKCVLTAEAQMYIVVGAERETEAALIFWQSGKYITCPHFISPRGHKFSSQLLPYLFQICAARLNKIIIQKEDSI